MCEFPILLPTALQDMIQDFITSALCERPDNYIDYAVEYHKKLKEGANRNECTRKRRMSPTVGTPREHVCSSIASKQQTVPEQSYISQNSDFISSSPQPHHFTTPSPPYGIYQLTSVSDEASVPPGTLLYRTCETPLYQSSNRAIVFVTDPAISHEVSSLVTTPSIPEKSESNNSLHLPCSTPGTPPHHKLVLNSLPPASARPFTTKTYNGHPQLSQHFNHACSTNLEEGLVCKCCGIIFRDALEYHTHYSQHIVHIAVDKTQSPTPQPIITNNIIPQPIITKNIISQPNGRVTLFKCLECDIMFKHFSSLRLHYYTHVQASQ
ncbi:hypothetical protein LOD99_12670 [Oopsacas minuta]|uniref:C2H2-type domain-containing protein n=1 Tax=Oopsacas minuta TaxID=111878 RepID=A0AAV7JDK2_9METZ|nr:hypothetical protein LOD99_12670 [Oopsacas minuta]